MSDWETLEIGIFRLMSITTVDTHTLACMPHQKTRRNWSTRTMARTQAVTPYSGFGMLTSYALCFAADLARKHDARIVIFHCMAPFQAQMHYKAGFSSGKILDKVNRS
ncbi:MAG: hypothetical protein ABSC55_10515 [Syntrophorhabdales bacterium]